MKNQTFDKSGLRAGSNYGLKFNLWWVPDSGSGSISETSAGVWVRENYPKPLVLSRVPGRKKNLTTVVKETKLPKLSWSHYFTRTTFSWKFIGPAEVKVSFTSFTLLLHLGNFFNFLRPDQQHLLQKATKPGMDEIMRTRV